jgi:hypothetical protein
MRAEPRWGNNWRLLDPGEATRIRLPISRRARRASERRLGELPIGTNVILVADARGGGRRCRAAAARAGIAVERTYLAFPSAAAPAYLVEDEPAPVRVFLKTILVAPPRAARWSLPMLAAVRILRSLGTWRLVRTLAPGCLLVGRRV